MILCVCNALSEDQVRDVARAGATCPNAAYQRLGCEAQCGACLVYAQEIIDEAHAAARKTTNVVRIRSAA